MNVHVFSARYTAVTPDIYQYFGVLSRPFTAVCLSYYYGFMFLCCNGHGDSIIIIIIIIMLSCGINDLSGVFLLPIIGYVVNCDSSCWCGKSCTMFGV